jgi:hypothetical protein
MRWRYRQAVGRTGKTRLGRLAALEMQQPALARAVPIAVGVVRPDRRIPPLSSSEV